MKKKQKKHIEAKVSMKSEEYVEIGQELIIFR